MNHKTAERTRIDKWLWAARFFKTRSLAAQAVESGKVLLNGERVKPAKALHVGDALRIRTPVYEYTVHVMALSDQRGSATIAALLYAETPESIAAREAARASRQPRDPASFIRGRPTKRDRRQLEQFRDEPEGG
ncbi:MAG: RNA-binding S4 domain-containing protein [Burkholderiales bacterium]|nr:RNA-binding S4 domain-containing protein [Burkholderiales bacterium]